MMEYFYTKIKIFIEGDETLGEQDLYYTVKAKLPLRNITGLYESVLKDSDEKCLRLHYPDDSYILVDSFERIDRLHNKYLEEQKRNLLFKAQ